MKEQSKLHVLGALVISIILIVPLTVTASGTDEATESGEVMQITWLFKPPSGEDTTWWLQELGRKFGVRLYRTG